MQRSSFEDLGYAEHNGIFSRYLYCDEWNGSRPCIFQISGTILGKEIEVKVLPTHTPAESKEDGIPFTISKKAVGPYEVLSLARESAAREILEQAVTIYEQPVGRDSAAAAPSI